MQVELCPVRLEPQDLAPVVELKARRVRTVLLQTSRSLDFRRQYLSAFEAALKYHASTVTVTRCVHEGRLSAVRVRQGRLFVDRRELAASRSRGPRRGRES